MKLMIRILRRALRRQIRFRDASAIHHGRIRRMALRLLQRLALLRRQAGQVHLVVVRMLPDGAGRVGARVHEELVLLLGVELADPALRERAAFVFHAAPVQEGDAVARDVEEGRGGGEVGGHGGAEGGFAGGVFVGGGLVGHEGGIRCGRCVVVLGVHIKDTIER